MYYGKQDHEPHTIRQAYNPDTKAWVGYYEQGAPPVIEKPPQYQSIPSSYRDLTPDEKDLQDLMKMHHVDNIRELRDALHKEARKTAQEEFDQIMDEERSRIRHETHIEEGRSRTKHEVSH